VWTVTNENMVSEARYRDLLESLPHIVFEINLNGRVTFANSNAFKIFGYTENGLLKDINVSDIIEGSDLNRARKDFRALLAGRRIKSTEYVASRQDGSTFPIIVFPSVVKRRGRTPGIRGIAIDLTQQKQLQNTARSILLQATQVQEEERRRIARDLHDDIGQALAVLSLQIDAMTRGKTTLSQDITESLRRLKARNDSILEKLRRFCWRLRPESLEQLGFIPALELLVLEINSETEINTRVRIMGAEYHLAPDTEQVLFRIAQEALNNVKIHSKATDAVLAVRYKEDMVRLTIRDNGTGFTVPDLLSDLPIIRGGLGLPNMQERARILGGVFRIKSEPGRGTTVTVQFRNKV